MGVSGLSAGQAVAPHTPPNAMTTPSRVRCWGAEAHERGPGPRSTKLRRAEEPSLREQTEDAVPGTRAVAPVGSHQPSPHWESALGATGQGALGSKTGAFRGPQEQGHNGLAPERQPQARWGAGYGHRGPGVEGRGAERARAELSVLRQVWP